MKTYAVVFYDQTYRTAQEIRVQADNTREAEWLAGRHCTISAGWRETLQIVELDNV